jgi:hypothetical protein
MRKVQPQQSDNKREWSYEAYEIESQQILQPLKQVSGVPAQNHCLCE